MRRTRGQTTVEVALGLLVLVPVILAGIWFAEAATFRLKATEAVTEPLWDATAYQNNSYTGAFNRTPGAVSSANAGATRRQVAHGGVFSQMTAPRVACNAGGGLGVSMADTAMVQIDNGGISCTADTTVDPKGMTRFFADGSNGLFQEPLAQMERQFHFSQTESGRPIRMAVGDWGLTNQNAEDDECDLTMGACANEGFFNGSKAVFQAHRTGGGTLNRAFVEMVDGVVRERPNDISRVVEFQMSFRGSESGFFENVPVDEGEPRWHTTPALGAWAVSYDNRHESFLGQ